MADLRESFPGLEDDATQAGVAAIARVEGDVAAAKAGAIGFAFKDSAGNVVLPQLNAGGQLPVTSEKAGNNLHDAQSIAGSAAEVDVATITLVAGKVYEDIFMQVSCFRDAVYRVVQIDDATTTELAAAVVGPGAYTHSDLLKGVEITAGATGTQELKIVASNLNALSDLRATVAAKEIVS